MDRREWYDMEKPAFQIVHDAKNVVEELTATRPSNPGGKNASPLKRLAPRRPKQQPEKQPKQNQNGD
jgi:hypothetical protein